MAVAKPKQQRMVLALAALAVMVAAGIVAIFALQDTAAYFKAPRRPEQVTHVRLDRETA